MAEPRTVRDHGAAVRGKRPFEEHGFDAVVVVKVLQVTEVRDRGGNMSGQVGGAVRRQLSVVRVGESGNLAPYGVTAAPGYVGLKAVDRVGMQHLGEVVEGVAVLSGSDVAAEGFSDLIEADEVVGGHRLLEPGDVVLIGQHVTEADCLFDA